MSPKSAFLLALLVPALAHAELADEFNGVRSYAMGGAHRGVGTSNDTLTLNPAGMAIVRRYSVEMQYAYSPFDKLTHISATAVDSKSGPIAGALGYTHDRGDDDGVDAGLHRFYLGGAYAITDGLAFGLTNRYVKGSYNDGERERSLNLYTADLGVMAVIAEGLSLGFAYNNIIKTKAPKLLPPTLGFGVGYQLPILTLAADVNIDIRRAKHREVSYRVGGEYLLGAAFPFRIGYAREPFVAKTGDETTENLMTGGLGWVSESGGLDVAFRQSLTRQKNWGLIAAFRFFL